MDKETIYWNQPRKLNVRTEPKGWGREEHISNIFGFSLDGEIKEPGYCLKLLVFDKPTDSSLHSHALKHEVFYIMSGKFKMIYVDPRDATQLGMDLNVGEAVVIPQNNLHKVICLEPGVIVEASTPDRATDNYRAAPGASQRKV